MEHRDSVIAYWGHQLALAAALVVPAILFLAFALQMSPQYQFVVQDAAARGWPLTWALAASFTYLALTLLLIRSLRYVDRVTVAAAFVAPAAFLASVFVAGGVTKAPVVAAALGVLGFALIFAVARPPWVLRPTPPTSRRYLAFVAAAVGIYLAAGTATAIYTVVVPRALGSLLILVVFAGTLGVLLCLCVLKPKVGALAFAYLLVATLLFSPNNHGVPPVRARAPAQDLDGAFADWLKSRKDKDAYRSRDLPYPVILVSSEGGGIYAAAHAYGTLSAIQKRCPTFGQHVFATVGVSGGAFGNLLFVSSVDPRQVPLKACGPTAAAVTSAPILADHLSPVLARLLLLETLDRLTPGPLLARDRAQVLSDSFLDSTPNQNYSRSSVGGSFDSTGARPAVISVAVNVATGHRVVLSPIRPANPGMAQWWPSGADPFKDQPSPRDQISLIDAAGLSARFPWITPTGRLPISEKEEILLADGGYFENSGADTVFDLLQALIASDRFERFQDAQCSAPGSGCHDPNKIDLVNGEMQCREARVFLVENFDTSAKWSSCRTPVFIIHFAIASREPLAEPATDSKGPVSRPDQSFLADPLHALLATRKSRGEIALRHMAVELCGTDDAGPSACYIQPQKSMGMFRNDISPDAWRLPLGWFMSRPSFERILVETAPRRWFDYQNHKQTAQKDTERLIYHLDPELYDPDAKPSIKDLAPAP